MLDALRGTLGARSGPAPGPRPRESPPPAARRAGRWPGAQWAPGPAASGIAMSIRVVVIGRQRRHSSLAAAGPMAAPGPPRAGARRGCQPRWH
jgi:hypothetical protein